MEISKTKTILALLVFVTGYLYTQSERVTANKSATTAAEEEWASEPESLSPLKQIQESMFESARKRLGLPAGLLTPPNRAGDSQSSVKFGDKAIHEINGLNIPALIAEASSKDMQKFIDDSREQIARWAECKAECMGGSEQREFQRLLNFQLELSSLRGEKSEALATEALELSLSLGSRSQEVALSYLQESLGDSAALKYLNQQHRTDIDPRALQNFIKELRVSKADREALGQLIESNAFASPTADRGSRFAKQLDKIPNLENRLAEISDKFCDQLKKLPSNNDKIEYSSSYYIGLRKAGFGREQLPHCGG